jgi:uncharacterized membrane protein YwzB
MSRRRIGSGNTTPLILHLETRWTWTVSLINPSLYSQRNFPLSREQKAYINAIFKQYGKYGLCLNWRLVLVGCDCPKILTQYLVKIIIIIIIIIFWCLQQRRVNAILKYGCISQITKCITKTLFNVCSSSANIFCPVNLTVIKPSHTLKGAHGCVRDMKENIVEFGSVGLSQLCYIFKWESWSSLPDGRTSNPENTNVH